MNLIRSPIFQRLLAPVPTVGSSQGRKLTVETGLSQAQIVERSPAAALIEERNQERVRTFPRRVGTARTSLRKGGKDATTCMVDQPSVSPILYPLSLTWFVMSVIDCLLLESNGGSFGEVMKSVCNIDCFKDPESQENKNDD
ncbi:uncharacterized protein LOC131258085 [Magnolia sinica]|uniref:uncharacterized protein LOC131258085 n=1 Tax=Magnolia sinica TaxID=86752 RepID=UPI00265AD3D1|nr:uncharacterized protein LOC131258085 [Magnolia sinica]